MKMFRSDIKLSKGRMASQAGHAALKLFLDCSNNPNWNKYLADSFVKVVTESTLNNEVTCIAVGPTETKIDLPLF